MIKTTEKLMITSWLWEFTDENFFHALIIELLLES